MLHRRVQNEALFPEDAPGFFRSRRAQLLMEVVVMRRLGAGYGRWLEFCWLPRGYGGEPPCLHCTRLRQRVK